MINSLETPTPVTMHDLFTYLQQYNLLVWGSQRLAPNMSSIHIMGLRISISDTQKSRGFLAQLVCMRNYDSVHMGRYRSPKKPLKERLYALCSEATVDEVHLLTVCSSLNEPREKLTTAMISICDYSSLDPLEKTKRILQACSSSQAISNAAYHMHLYRASLLR